MERTPETLLEAVTYFADPDRAHAYAVAMRWPNGVACPRPGCGSADVQAIATRKLWRCKECKRQFSVRVGSVFEASPIPFTKWLPAFWLLANTKNGTSSCELARAIGVTQKTAWFMFHRIREAMGTKTFATMLEAYGSGAAVEVDETFVGGKRRNKHLSAGTRTARGKSPGPRADKTAVLGMVERGGRVRAMTIPDVTTKTLVGKVREHVRGGSTVYTDAWHGYRGLEWAYSHRFVDHRSRYAERVIEGYVHTNTIENFWSCFKRTVKGTYICPRPFHLDAYAAEQVFRFNEREENDGGRFVSVLKGADGKRLTYAALTTSHPRWRTLPPAPIPPRRRPPVDPNSVSGVSDRL